MSGAMASSDPLWIALMILGAFAVVFPLFWAAVLVLLSQIGGWSRLAQRFPAGDRPVTGEPRLASWAMVGPISYRFVLTVRVNADGFFLTIMPLFRIAHPPLFIPWMDVTGRKPWQFLWMHGERISIGEPHAATLTVPDGVI